MIITESNQFTLNPNADDASEKLSLKVSVKNVLRKGKKNHVASMCGNQNSFPSQQNMREVTVRKIVSEQIVERFILKLNNGTWVV